MRRQQPIISSRRKFLESWKQESAQNGHADCNLDKTVHAAFLEACSINNIPVGKDVPEPIPNPVLSDTEYRDYVDLFVREFPSQNEIEKWL